MPAAASTHSCAAVAQAVPEDSAPVIAVSYRPIELYGAFTRSATSPASTGSPSPRVQTSLSVSGRTLVRSVLTSEMPQSIPARRGANSIATSGLMLSFRRMVSVRCRYTSAVSPISTGRLTSNSGETIGSYLDRGAQWAFGDA